MRLVNEFNTPKTRCTESVHPFHCNIRSEQEIHAEPTCECGRDERHTHCRYCGFLISIGDWAAPSIATLTVRL